MTKGRKETATAAGTREMTSKGRKGQGDLGGWEGDKEKRGAEGFGGKKI